MSAVHNKFFGTGFNKKIEYRTAGVVATDGSINFISAWDSFTWEGSICVTFG